MAGGGGDPFGGYLPGRSRYTGLGLSVPQRKTSQWQYPFSQSSNQNYSSFFGVPSSTQHPSSGVVGTPDLGRASELMRYAGQVPGGEQYLRSMGMMPEVSTVGITMGNSPRQYGNAQSTTVSNPWQSISPDILNRYASGEFGQAQQQYAQGLLSSRGTGGIGGTGIVTGQDYQREQLPMEQTLEQQIGQLFKNPTGYNSTQQQQLRNRASEPYAIAQQQAMEQTRQDAARRGITGGDEQIRDQLNRVAMQGAKGQQGAQLDIDQMLAQLTQQGRIGGIQAGTGLLGQQLGDVRSLREMITMLQALQQQGGMQGGLQFLMGGGK